MKSSITSQFEYVRDQDTPQQNAKPSLTLRRDHLGFYTPLRSRPSQLRARVRQAAHVLLLLVAAGVAIPCRAGNSTLALSSAVTVIPVKQGGEAAEVITVTVSGSSSGNVALAVSGLPSSIAAWWSSDSIALRSGVGSSTLTLAPSAATPTNWYSFTVTASGGGASVSRQYVAQVRPAVGMQIEFASTALSLWHGGSSSLAVTVAPLHETTVSAPGIQLVSRLPSGVTAWWGQPVANPGGAFTWTLHLAATSAVSTGSYPVELSASCTDSQSGLSYTTTQQFPLLISLVATAAVNVEDDTGPAVSPTFMGLSHEWWEPIHLMGEAATGTNLIYRQLLNNLTAYGSGPIHLRIGGESTDLSGMPGATTIPPMAELAKALGSKFDLGVNLGSNNVGLAADQAAAYVSQMPAGSIEAIEIGNEPDLYMYNHFRSTTYTLEDYFADFETWKNDIMPVLPADVKLMGPAWASTGMLWNLPAFLLDNARDLSVISVHSGAVQQKDNPPPDVLLTPTASTGGVYTISAQIPAAHAQGLSFRIGEWGSAPLGGISGISNAFAAALWQIDSMFEYANAGVDGVNWTASMEDYNDPFSFASSTVNGANVFSLTSVTPTYYGLLFFQDATAKGARLLPVDLAAQANFKAWATRDSAGTPRVALINKDQLYAGAVALTVPGYNHASVLRLTAPSYKSTTGVRFAGQTFDGSPDGKIQGTQQIETIEGSNSVFEVSIDVTSAALLIFSK